MNVGCSSHRILSAFKTVVRKPEETRPFASPKSTQENNITSNLPETVCKGVD
jgi:hypothetical protein